MNTGVGKAGLGALILAAGKGTRMHGERPKVLYTLLGEPMLGYVHAALDTALGQRLPRITVSGYKAEEVEAAYSAEQYVRQEQQLGTGHAVQVAWEAVKAAGITRLLVVNGDTPLLPGSVLSNFLEATTDAALAFVSLSVENPGAFGRVLRGQDGSVAAIIEAKDYDARAHGPEPREINCGIYVLDVAAVGELLFDLDNANKSGEFYITDLVYKAVAAGLPTQAFDAAQVLAETDNDLGAAALLGVNSPLELVNAEEALARAMVGRWLTQHVLIRNPFAVRIGPRVSLAPGAELVGPCELYGVTSVAEGARVLSHTVLLDSEVGPGAQVRSFSHLEQAKVGPGCWVGPYARLRPGAVLEENARVGNFVEMKKATLGPGAKASHLTYLGDAEVGAGANIGAGTITCNYDGVNKHKTQIGEGAFIGSNTALVAPVTVGPGALVGAGSVITRNVAEGELAIGRGRQVNLKRTRSS